MTSTATRTKSGPTPRRDEVRKSRSRDGGHGTVGGVGAVSAAATSSTASRLRRAVDLAAGRTSPRAGGWAARSTTWLRTWFAVYVIVAAHISVISVAAGMAWPILALVYLAPAAATLYCRRDARRHWWRFPAAFALTFVAYPGPNIVAFLMAEAFAIHEPWFRTVHPGDRRLLPRIPLPRPVDPARGTRRGKEKP